MDTITQTIQSSLLDLMLQGRDPQYIGRYSMSNQIQRAIANLAGVDGEYSRLIACDEYGNLRVAADAAHPLQVNLAQDEDHQLIVLVAVNGEGNPAPLGLDPDGGLGVNINGVLAPDAVEALAAILDVYDATNHCLNVKVITP